MRKREKEYTVKGFGETLKVSAKTSGGAAYKFKKWYLSEFEATKEQKLALCSHGHDTLKVSPRLPPLYDPFWTLTPTKEKENGT